MALKGEKAWGIYLLCSVIFSAVLHVVFYHFFLCNNPCRLMFDAGHYHAMASDLLKYGLFCDGAGNYYFYRLPVYPIFLAASYWLGGINAVMIIQSLLSLLISVLCFFIAREFGFGDKIALWGAFFTGVHPGFLIFSGLVMTEILFTFFFLLSFFLLMRESGWRKKQSKFLLLIAGICLGLASLTRAVVGFPLLICTLFVVLILSHGLLREKIIGSFTLAFGWISVISIWCVRNYLLTGYIFLQAFSGNHCINHGAVPVVMRSQGCSYAQARDSVYADLCHDHFIATQKKQDCLDQVEKCFVAQATAAKIMLCHPYALMHHSIINMIKTLCGLYSSELLVIDS
ncbi:MAG: phospholipid carrier-dependent glycosyltransferase, partial [Candidatus Babeliales bacterium]